MKLLVAKMKKKRKQIFGVVNRGGEEITIVPVLTPSLKMKFDYLLFLNSICSEDFRLYKCDALRDLVLLYNLTNVKNAHGGVLLLVKLQVKSCYSQTCFNGHLYKATTCP